MSGGWSPAEPPVAALPPRYYLDNFRSLHNTVVDRYGDILSPQEHDWLKCFSLDLSEEAQCLYLRLVSRVGPWFRQSRLSYPELGSLDLVVEELLEQSKKNEYKLQDMISTICQSKVFTGK